jgi:hypothetical protein
MVYAELKRIFAGLEDQRVPKVLAKIELNGRYTDAEVVTMLTKVALIGYFTIRGGYLDLEEISHKLASDSDDRYKFSEFVSACRVLAIDADKALFKTKLAEHADLPSSVIAELKAAYKAASQGSKTQASVLSREELQHAIGFTEVNQIIESSGLVQYFDKDHSFTIRGMDRASLEIVTIKFVFTEAAGHTNALITFAAFSKVALKFLTRKVTGQGKAFGNTVAPIKFSPTSENMVERISETFVGFGTKELDTFEGFGDAAALDKAAASQLAVMKPVKKSYSVTRTSGSRRISNWKEQRGNHDRSSSVVENSLPRIPPTVIRAMICLIDGASFESVEDNLASIELEHILLPEKIRDIYENAGLMRYLHADGVDKLSFDVILADANKDRDGMVSLKLFVDLTAMKLDQLNIAKKEAAASGSNSTKPRQPFSGTRVAKQKPMKSSKEKGTQKTGFFNTLRRKKLRGGGQAHGDETGLLPMTVKRTMDFPETADYLSCEAGDVVQVVRDLPDGSYIIETPQGRKLLHEKAFTERAANDYDHMAVAMPKSFGGSTSKRRTSKWTIFGE